MQKSIEKLKQKLGLEKRYLMIGTAKDLKNTHYQIIPMNKIVMIIGLTLIGLCLIPGLPLWMIPLIKLAMVRFG